MGPSFFIPQQLAISQTRFWPFPQIEIHPAKGLMHTVENKSTENGPNLVYLDDKVFTALCRCGGSSNKPLCDGTHAKIGFHARPADLKVLAEHSKVEA